MLQRREIQAELRKLKKEERQRQERAVEEVMGNATVVCSTLTGVAQRLMQAIRLI